MKLNRKPLHITVAHAFAPLCIAIAMAAVIAVALPAEAAARQATLHTSAQVADVLSPLARQRWSREQGGAVSKDEAAAIVKRRFGGRILAVAEVEKDGRPMYRVKGLSQESQVYVVFVDKNNGRIVR
ncbi:hypothetical protein Maes01_00320 [Microbulbifer aestuariivivens]|uniref:PepSY domain-containing protein n=1 Tax=Microbulbifer aestuariivivens TaxID=1908308 RepID=A0ABP9WKP0_9GAMM